ncbi:exonuclease SbcCD subunit D [Streptomyces sp. NBC_01221]|uniref:exonuclease SbcCD subunit D n=1 Tax=Streptomyces sp. NBC_01221 TaxID=2903782 RepID=UPI00225C0274|nr:exonuclease SbcCD subunit D [Streptomyces sp. NBC_01221]MCX4791593.1 exonuclease SbcCD subunit D [Streptomyces sp. NBC_01221]
MRFLHTSDWHLGRRFHGEDLIDAQHKVLDHICDTARTEQVDALLVAGDIYDRAIPSLDAVRLFSRGLNQMASLGIPTIMISGNHDSAHRLGVGSSLLARAGVHLRTDPADAATPILLNSPTGTVAVYGVPYLEPTLVRTRLEAEAASHQAVLTSALDQIRADVATRPTDTRSVVLAHAFITGATGCKSERDISVGGVDHAPTSVFDGIDYVALGHLHGARQVNDRIHYSGSPLAYSFSETGHNKSLTLIDLPAGAAAPTVTRHALPAHLQLPLARLTGRLEDLLTDPAHEAHTKSWLHVTLTDTARPYEPMARLKQRFPHTLDLQHIPTAIPAQSTTSPTYSERLRGRGDLDITHDFITTVRGTQPNDEERSLLQEAIDNSRVSAQEKETV